jgi:hypothetical protein
MAIKKDVLERVRKDKKLLAEHGITSEELDRVAKVEMFGTLKSIDDVLFIVELTRHYRSRP